jgi:ankyrin repeat protein
MMAKSFFQSAALFQSAARNDTVTIRWLASLRIDLDQQDEHGRTAMHIATQHDNYSAVVALLRAGASIDTLDSCSQTALHIAVKTSRYTISRKIHKEAYMRDQFYCAVYQGLSKKVEWYCKEEDVNLEMTFGRGYTALLVASYLGHSAVVQTLLLAGADIHARSEFNDSPLSCAAHQGQTAVVEALLWTIPGHGNPGEVHDIDRALYLAASNGFKDIVGILIDAGGTLEFRDISTGNTALITASQQGHAAVVSLLLYHGATASARNAQGVSAMEYALEKRYKTVACVLQTPPVNWQCDVERHIMNPARFISLARYCMP